MRFLNRLYQNTVWSNKTIAEEDVRVNGLIRRSIPRFYVAVVVFGVLGAIGGTPALRSTFGDPYAKLWSAAVTATAIICLIGFAYSKNYWKLEVISAMVLNGWLFLYIAALTFASIQVFDIGRLAVGAILFATTELPWWRVQDIYKEQRKRGTL